MAETTAKVQVTIVDPDIRIRIDGVHVYKRRTSNGQQEGKWALEDYESTREIDLDNGTYYLEMIPYWRGVDPLPVWAEVKNMGDVSLSVECVVSEGKRGYKRLTVLKGGKSINVPGIYNLSYRVGVSTLPDLHISYLRSVSKRRGKLFENAGFVKIRDLKDQDAAKLSPLIAIRSWKLARTIREAELACSIKLDPEKFEKISHWRVSKIYDTPMSELMNTTEQPQKIVMEMMDRLGELALAIDYPYIRKITLDMVFDY